MAEPTAKVVESESQEEMGFSLQDDVRFAIWNSYQRLNALQLVLLEEYSKQKGMVKVATARKALNEMYGFVENSGVRVKNLRNYKNKQLYEFDKFLFYYFVPQQKIINEEVENNQDLMPVSQDGFSIQHWLRWKAMCYYFLEVSGITKFERKQPLSAEYGYGAS